MKHLLTWIMGFTWLAPAGLAAGKPNIVFVLTDQWRAAAFGFAGDPNVKTPQLDTLAAQSVRFTNAVSVCPVCTPYRAALMTGRFPTSTGMFLNDLYLPEEELCMGEIFKAAGYDTAYIGKWHLDGHGRSSYIPPARRQGFDYWKVAECDHNYQHSHYYAGTSATQLFWPGYDAFAQSADAQQYLRGHASSDKPFLLFLAFGQPHFPHDTAPAGFRAMYAPEQLTLAPNVPAASAAAVRQELAGYYAHCSALDQCIGELLATLKETGLADHTIVVFTSDHGEMMGAHGISPQMKQWPYDEAVLVPFLLHDPRTPARTVNTPLGTPDILPTLLGLAGVAVPPTVEGEDLSAWVTSGGPGPERAVLTMSVSPFIPRLEEYRGIRTSRHSYVRNLAGAWLLFDNASDPYQLHNLAEVPAHAGLRQELDTRLQAELKKIGDEFQPRQFYLDRWGYSVARQGSISYAPNAKVQSPRPHATPKP
ncbi:MAG: sulfatase [Verrucomicrobia bacterium]|nr:sulfatase [Verrucomicrobiota bacterium]